MTKRIVQQPNSSKAPWNYPNFITVRDALREKFQGFHWFFCVFLCITRLYHRDEFISGGLNHEKTQHNHDYSIFALWPFSSLYTFQTTVLDLGVTLDSALTFSQHISNLTRSSYFQLRRLRTIRKAVSVHIFTSIVHAFVCSMIDYCNSLLIGLPKTRLSSFRL